MSLPRLLPVVGVAIVGVMAVNALGGADRFPELLSGARAFAEEAAGQTKLTKTDPKPEANATTPAANLPAAAKPAAVCAPTAAELAKEAGLSPAELRILQSLGDRRGQLDQREQDMSTQLALLAAAEAKLDAKVKTMNGLKAEVQALLNTGDAKQEAEVVRMTKVFESMKPKMAAERLVVLDDAVRLPIAAKMKERALSAVLAQMAPDEAKRLTESLARRYAALQSLAAAANAPPTAAAAAPTPAAAPATPVQQAKADPAAAKPAVKAPPRKKPAPTKMAAAAPKKAPPKPAEPEPQLPGKPQAYTPPPPAPPAAAPETKAG